MGTARALSLRESPTPGISCKMSCTAVALRHLLTGPVKGMKLSLKVKFLTAAVLEGRLLAAVPRRMWRSLRMAAIVSSRPSSLTTLPLLEELLWVWLPSSWPSSSLLLPWKKDGLYITVCLIPEAASMRVKCDELSDIFMLIGTACQTRGLILRSDSSLM